MSATLTWKYSGLGTKTGTAVGNLFTDLKTLVDSKSADANFAWEISASSLASTPYYLWFRRKDSSAGRILFISWTSAPAGNNAAILETAPSTASCYLAWFPDGTAASPSNLTASSGTISGDDTDCVKCACVGSNSSIYTASFVPYYFDTAEGLYFGWCNPASSGNYAGFAGDLVVDAADNAYGVTAGYNGAGMQTFGGSTSTCPWSATGGSSGTAGVYLVSNYTTQSTSIKWFHAFAPSAGYPATTIGATNILVDTTNTDVWFIPVLLVASGIKGGGFPIKLRQIGWGPNTSAAFEKYNSTGPVEQAVCPIASTTGSSQGPIWLTNFKI